MRGTGLYIVIGVIIVRPSDSGFLRTVGTRHSLALNQPVSGEIRKSLAYKRLLSIQAIRDRISYCLGGTGQRRRPPLSAQMPYRPGVPKKREFQSSGRVLRPSQPMDRG